MSTKIKDDHLFLPDYFERFLQSEFIPFPSIDYAIETLIETASYLETSEDRVYFYIRIIKRLEDEINAEREY